MAYFAAKGKISAGSFLTIMTLMNYIIDPVMSIENSLLSIHSLNVSLWRLEKLLGNKPFQIFSESPSTNPASVEIRNITFGYTSSRNILNNFSLRLNPGRCYFLLGGNGAGKSTLIKLIGGVIHPSSGQIFLCGNKANDIQSLVSYLSIMPQEPVLFSDSILENIRLYEPELTQHAVENACKKVGLHEQILCLPNGYETILSENGAPLSGGQKQRLSLARTILRNKPIMIFDEPTAALDAAHATQAAQVIEELAQKRVVIVITHDTRLNFSEGNIIRLGE